MKPSICAIAAVGILCCSIYPAGGAAQTASETMSLSGESFVLVGEEPGLFVFTDIELDSVVVRSTYRPDKEGSILYEAGRDYIVDPEAGTLRRTADSRIPDFSTNVLYGESDFNHTEFPGYGNLPFFVFVGYTTQAGTPFGAKSDQHEQLSRSRVKLEAGGPFKIVVYGDSIAAGGEATDLELRYPRLYAQHLRSLFPKAEIEVENGATGGDSTQQGLQRLEEKVLTRSPDLVLVGFGMNDNNVGGVTVPEFRESLLNIVRQIQDSTGADVILHSAFPPNPNWKFGSDDMPQIAKMTEEVAAETGCAFADVYGIWTAVLERKRPESLLGNNINHPNDFGHWLYFQALKNIQF